MPVAYLLTTSLLVVPLKLRVDEDLTLSLLQRKLNLELQVAFARMSAIWSTEGNVLQSIFRGQLLC